MQIRNEKPEDRAEIATLIARTYMSDGVEVIEKTGILRDMPAYDTKHTFVAEEDGEMLAYALFTLLKVGDNGEALLLAPLAIDTNKEFDIAGFLSEIFETLKNQGHNYILMHGDVNQYKDLGFVDAKKMGIDDGLSVEGVDLMIKNISDTPVTEIGMVDLPECLRSNSASA